MQLNVIISGELARKSMRGVPHDFVRMKFQPFWNMGAVGIKILAL
jgi:hypothetical protein